MTNTDHPGIAAAKADAQTERHQAQVELDAAISALASKPQDLAARQAVATASRKLAEITSSLAHLDAAATQAQVQARAADRAGRVERRAAQRLQIRELAPVVDEAAAAIIKHIERLGPLLAAYEAAASDYSGLCVALAREAEVHLRSGFQHSTGQLLQQTDPNRGHLPEAVATALWNAGLSRVGPHLEILGVAPFPGRGEYQTDPLGAYLADTKDLRRNVQNALDRADQTLAERDARAA